MKAISFAWTTPALLAGRKTVTRREWNNRYARSFKDGELVAALDKVYRAGGKQVATIRLTQAPYQSDKLPEGDWEGEGFAYLESIGATVNGETPHALWHSWLAARPVFWVVRFELVEVSP